MENNLKGKGRETDFNLLYEQRNQLGELLWDQPDDPLWGLVNYLDFVLDSAEANGEFEYPAEAAEAAQSSEGVNLDKEE